MKKLVKYSWLLVLPVVAAAVVIWKSSADPVGNCPYGIAYRTVCLPNSSDCGTYFSCADGIPILMYCPDGLHWNAKLDVCDWPQDAGCITYGVEYREKVECWGLVWGSTGPVYRDFVMCGPGPSYCSPYVPC